MPSGLTPGWLAIFESSPRPKNDMYQIQKNHDFLIGVDSDGCVFDTMELKHKECFIPNIIKFYRLQSISKYAREAAEFVNLYSKSRGINRFPALIEALQWLGGRQEIVERGFEISVPQSLVNWIEKEDQLGNPALEKALAENEDPQLRHALDWSLRVNQDIAEMVSGVAPFNLVAECLETMNQKADVFVCSATPNEALESEWAEHGLRKFVQAICGQEAGSKKENLSNAKNYDTDHCLMIGDAPGDHRAAVANQCLFFPILPGQESESWVGLHNEGLRRFFDGTFAGNYQEKLLQQFDQALPTSPTWKQV